MSQANTKLAKSRAELYIILCPTCPPPPPVFCFFFPPPQHTHTEAHGTVIIIIEKKSKRKGWGSCPSFGAQGQIDNKTCSVAFRIYLEVEAKVDELLSLSRTTSRRRNFHAAFARSVIRYRVWENSFSRWPGIALCGTCSIRHGSVNIDIVHFSSLVVV